MRLRLVAFAAGCLLMSGIAHSQSIDELRAQLAETQAMIDQAEAAGVDPSMIQSLRENMEIVEQAIREMEQDQASAGSDGDSEPAAIEPAAAEYQPNLAVDACDGFNEVNYRQKSLADGNDEQLRTLCGQAFEYYTMYKRAVDQQHPEAWRTYEAHQKVAAVLNNFLGETRAGPGEGIVPDTRTAAETAQQDRERRAAAEASALPPPPRAPDCEGCASPQ